jgi:hypothetical protein
MNLCINSAVYLMSVQKSLDQFVLIEENTVKPSVSAALRHKIPRLLQRFIQPASITAAGRSKKWLAAAAALNLFG